MFCGEKGKPVVGRNCGVATRRGGDPPLPKALRRADTAPYHWKNFELPPWPSFSIGFDSQDFEDSLQFVVAEEGDFQCAFALCVTKMHFCAEAFA